MVGVGGEWRVSTGGFVRFLWYCVLLFYNGAANTRRAVIVQARVSLGEEFNL